MNTRLVISSLAVVGLSLTACGEDGDQNGEQLTGTIIDTFVTLDDEVDVPRDLSADFDLEVLVPEDDGEVTSLPAIGADDGTFVVEDVPPGLVYVRFETTYRYTDERELDLGVRTFRRADAVRTSGPANIALDLDNLAPWEFGNDLELISADTFGWTPLSFVAPPVEPAPGATELAATIDYAGAVNSVLGEAFLHDGAEGDRFFITQLVNRVSPEDVRYRSIDRVLEPEPFSLMEGQTATVEGTMEPVAQTESLAVTRDQAALDAHFAAMLPPDSTGVLAFASFAVTADFGAPLDAPFGAFATLLSMDVTDSGPVTLSYADPFADTAAEIGSLSLLTATLYEDPDGNPVILPVFSTRVGPVDAFDGEALALTFEPVEAPLIDGEDALAIGDPISATPTLSWDPPASAPDARYSVLIHEIAGQRRRVAALLTDQTELPIPPGVLAPGATYVFEIRAITGEQPLDQEIAAMLTEAHTVATE